jgi:hypothetical protein
MRRGTRTGHAADRTARIGRRLGAVCTVASATFLVSASGAFAVTSPCGSSGVLSSSGATQTCTYTTTGEDTFTVPAGATSVHVVAVGGEGAANMNGSPGGFGAQVSADLPVSSGAGFYVEVGGDGAPGSNVSTGGPNGGHAGGPGGSGGGGAGSMGGDGGGPEGAGGQGGAGGGGATDLRLLPAAAGLSPDTRLVVAGGGGGAGSLGFGPVAALNGGAAGAPGLGDGTSVYNGGGGGAGAASAGGSGGAGGLIQTYNPGQMGFAGALGVGGAGGAGGTVDNDYGGPGGEGAGGGGGGYYGGGGGGGGATLAASGGGGGGGSSYVTQNATNAIIATDSTGIPSMTISWSVPQSADLGVTITGPSSAADGATFTETVKVANAGPAAASDLLTWLVIPKGITATKLDHRTLSGSAPHWTRAALAAGKSVTYTVTFAVAAGAEGTAQIVAETASLRIPDPQPANNTAIAVVSLGSSSAALAMAMPRHEGAAAPLIRR